VTAVVVVCNAWFGGMVLFRKLVRFIRVGSVSFQADGILSNDGFAPSLPLSGDSVLFFGASYASKLSLTAFYIRGIRFAERYRSDMTCAGAECAKAQSVTA
jgi:hypothetical protein